MKKSIIVQFWFTALICSLSTSCIKDKDYDEGRRGIIPDKNSKIVEIEGPQQGFYNVDLIATNTDTSIENFVTVRLASNEPVNNDVQVTLTLNPSLVSEYNANNGTNYVVPAAGLYTIPTLTVTIPKGERRGYLKLTTRAANLLGTEYALGFQLNSISDGGIKLSGNFSNQVVAFAVRNKYDGEYTMSVQTLGWAAYGISSGPTLDWPRHVDLITASANSVDFYDEVVGSLQPGFTSGGGATAFGATTPRYSFDTGNDKMISVMNTTPDDGRGRTLYLNPAITTSRFDPATKTIYAAYLMTQNGRPDQEIYIIFTYVGPR